MASSAVATIRHSMPSDCSASHLTKAHMIALGARGKCSHHHSSQMHCSKQGDWGDWGGVRYCDGFITGFQLRIEGDQRGGDDTATNNIRVKCSTGEELTGDGMDYGEWREWSHCPRGKIVRDIQTLV